VRALVKVRSVASLHDVETAIFEKEGFRVRLVPFEGRKAALPPYRFDYMASNKWKISDWKNARLAAYVPFIKTIEVFRGDGSTVKSDLRLGNLRDSYFDAYYGEA